MLNDEVHQLNPVQVLQVADAINFLSCLCHSRNERWWIDPTTKEKKERNVGEMLMLCVSELAEAMEGHRKDLHDDHLTHRMMFHVELIDCLIRVFDLLGATSSDPGVIFVEKTNYNASREDHKLENRIKEGGKQY